MSVRGCSFNTLVSTADRVIVWNVNMVNSRDTHREISPESALSLSSMASPSVFQQPANYCLAIP